MDTSEVTGGEFRTYVCVCERERERECVFCVVYFTTAWFARGATGVCLPALNLFYLSRK